MNGRKKRTFQSFLKTILGMQSVQKSLMNGDKVFNESDRDILESIKKRRPKPYSETKQNQIMTWNT
jgi:hypothetical protein